MTHDDALTLAVRGLATPLSPDERTLLTAHLRECASCRSEVERLHAADEALAAWGGARPQVSSPGGAPPAIPLRRWWPVAAAAMLGLVVGALGATSRRSPDAAPRAAQAADSLPSFVLLLEEPAGTWPPTASLMRPGYFEWRDSLLVRGQFAGGERLAEDEGWYLGVDGTRRPANARPASQANYSGLFVIHAADYEEAISIARGSPHLRYGGILVRRTY